MSTAANTNIHNMHAPKAVAKLAVHLAQDCHLLSTSSLNLNMLVANLILHHAQDYYAAQWSKTQLV